MKAHGNWPNEIEIVCRSTVPRVESVLPGKKSKFKSKAEGVFAFEHVQNMQSCQSNHEWKRLDEVCVDKVVNIVRLLAFRINHDTASSLVERYTVAGSTKV